MMTSAGVETAILHLDLAGIVYPFRIAGGAPGSWRLDHEQVVAEVPTLMTLASRSLTRDHNVLASVLHWIPRSLFITLLEASFKGKHDVSTDLIIARWPFENLRLTDVFSEGVFPNLSCATFRAIQLERLCESLSYTTGLVSGFIHYLKRTGEEPGRLKYLDITGFPTAEVVAIYLFSHCVIAINEHRQSLLWQRMLELKAERARLNPGNPSTAVDESQNKQRCSFRAGSGYVARVDLRIDSEYLLDQLLPCFNDTDDGGGAAKFRVSIGNFYILGLHDTAVLKIFRTIQLHELTGLCLAYSQMCLWQTAITTEIFQLLERCSSLTSLDLSNNGLAFQDEEYWTVAFQLKLLLSKLPRLRRLNLSVNRITGKLMDVIPPNLCLTHLSLDGCRLSSTDIDFMGSPNFNRNQLQYLDLAHLRTITNPAAFISLMNVFAKSVWPRLSVLIMSHSRLDGKSVTAFSKILLCHEEIMTHMKLSQPRVPSATMSSLDDDEFDEVDTSEFPPGLVYFDITEKTSRMKSPDLLEAFQYLFKLRTLRYLKIEYPHDCFQMENVDYSLDQEKAAFFEENTLRIKQECNSAVELVYKPSSHASS